MAATRQNRAVRKVNQITHYHPQMHTVVNSVKCIKYLAVYSKVLQIHLHDLNQMTKYKYVTDSKPKKRKRRHLIEKCN